MEVQANNNNRSQRVSISEHAHHEIRAVSSEQTHSPEANPRAGLLTSNAKKAREAGYLIHNRPVFRRPSRSELESYLSNRTTTDELASSLLKPAVPIHTLHQVQEFTNEISSKIEQFTLADLIQEGNKKFTNCLLNI
jgi:hypothetical protein